MTGDEFRAARLALGLATQQIAADRLEVDVRTVGRWERGDIAVPGPVKVALRLMRQLAGQSERQRARSSAQST